MCFERLSESCLRHKSIYLNSLIMSMIAHSPNLWSYPVEVRDAGHMGKGVFATKNIKRGNICCFYDGVKCANLEHATLTSNAFGYAQALKCGIILAGFKKQFHNGGVAQLINDASTDYKNDRDKEYLKNINVTFVDAEDMDKPLICVATRNIKKGEQLFYNYGCDTYWKARKEREADPKQKDLTPKSIFKQKIKAFEKKMSFGKTLTFYLGIDNKKLFGEDLNAYAARAVFYILYIADEKLREQFDKLVNSE